jgi:adenylosuccinate synthase
VEKIMNIAVLGSFFGDESKGSFTHHLSYDFEWVIRTSGGNNCGHTIYRSGKKYVHHLVPSVDWICSKAKAFLGAGMVINPSALLEELQSFEKDFPGVSKRVYVDPDAFAVLPHHIEEDKAKNKDLGSTGRGIGPAYTEKISRRGTRLQFLINANNPDILSLKELGVKFRYVLSLYDEFKSSRLLFEGAQSALLDPNFGTYPFVTSGDCLLNSIYNSGFSFAMPTKVYGVAKPYGTRVGTGPFPTEYFGEEADTLRKLGSEFGATTGRPRRVGALDLPALRYAIKRAGITDLIMSKFDILDGLDTVKVCVAYEEGDPVSGESFFDAKPIYEDFPGWDHSGQTSQLHYFINKVQEAVGCNISYISCGTEPKDISKLY